MKRCLPKLLIAIVLLFTIIFLLVKNNTFVSVLSNNTSFNSYTIIIDAGHGGEDGGAVTKDGTLEKDINLDISLKLEEILKFYGFNVIMTRKTDTMTCDENLQTQRQKKISDIRNRFEIIKENNDAFFVSIHQNNFSDSSQKGAQVFYSPKSQESNALAKTIQDSFVSSLQPENKRTVKKSGTNIYLLYHAEIPAVMVECGFLSNSEDLTNLKNENYKLQTAMVIADGILKYVLNR